MRVCDRFSKFCDEKITTTTESDVIQLLSLQKQQTHRRTKIKTAKIQYKCFRTEIKTDHIN